MLSRVRRLHPYRGEDNLFSIIENLLEGRIYDVFHIYLKVSELLFMKDFLVQPDLLRDSLEAIGLFKEVSSSYFKATDGVSPFAGQIPLAQEKQINDRL